MVSGLLNIPWSVGNECFTLSLTQNAIIGHFRGYSTEGCPKNIHLMHYCQQNVTDERLLAPALEPTKDDRWILLTEKIFEESPNEYWISSFHPREQSRVISSEENFIWSITINDKGWWEAPCPNRRRLSMWTTLEWGDPWLQVENQSFFWDIFNKIQENIVLYWLPKKWVLHWVPHQFADLV